jgi:signal transduction histidine kinase
MMGRPLPVVRGTAPRIALVLLLGLFAWMDSAVLSTWWQLPGFLVVAALALVGLARRSATLIAVAVAASLAMTVVTDAVLVVETDVRADFIPDSFGLVEVAALLLVVVDRWRVVARPADRLLVAAAVAAVIALPLRVTDLPWRITDSRAVLDTTVVLVAFVALAAAVGTALRAQDTRRRTAVAAVRRDERAEIARELHDVVAHHVTGIVVATQGARVVAAGRVAPPVDTALQSIEDCGAEALAAMRRLVGVLRTEVDAATGAAPAGPLSPVPVLSDLDELVRRFRETGAVGHVELDVLLDDRYRPGLDLQAATYRVVQEALTNACRHALGAARVEIAVVSTTGVLEIQVSNSAGARTTPPGEPVAPGGDTGRPVGFGLVGMRERVEALGGFFTAGPRADGGWTVHATIPLPASPLAASPLAAQPLPAARGTDTAGSTARTAGPR